MTVLKRTVGFILTLLMVLITYVGLTLTQVWMRAGAHTSEHAQAVLVLGTTEYNGVPSPTLERRLETVWLIWQHHQANWVVTTGGRQPGDVYTEAGVSATWLIARGVPVDKILVAGGSDTWENLRSALPTLRAHGIVHVLIVSDPFHVYRAMEIARVQGLAPLPAPALHSWFPHSAAFKYYVKEAVEVAVARIVGYERLSHWTLNMTSISPRLP